MSASDFRRWEPRCAGAAPEPVPAGRGRSRKPPRARVVWLFSRDGRKPPRSRFLLYLAFSGAGVAGFMGLLALGARLPAEAPALRLAAWLWFAGFGAGRLVLFRNRRG